MNRTVSPVTTEEIARASHTASILPFPQKETTPDVNSTKYLNQMPIEELYEFFVPFGISDPTQVSQIRENGKLKGLIFYCDDFNAHINSDFDFQFGFFDYSADEYRSLGRTIRYYELVEFSNMLGLTKHQTMALLLTGVFINKFPEYKKEWKQLLDAGKIPMFKDKDLPTPFRSFDNLSTIFSLSKEINENRNESLHKQLM